MRAEGRRCEGKGVRGAKDRECKVMIGVQRKVGR